MVLKGKVNMLIPLDFYAYKLLVALNITKCHPGGVTEQTHYSHTVSVRTVLYI